MQSPQETAPQVSIVIPVYNEEAILRTAVLGLLERLAGVPWTYELLLAENGSTDSTREIASNLSLEIARVESRHVGEPNYGKALRDGILAARGEFVVCDEIDLCDTDFHERALDILRQDGVDMVVGSKAMKGARDERPWKRRLGTVVINSMLRIMLGFQGTDTHGLKAFRREALTPIARACVVDGNLFASELVIRAERAGLSVVEIPVRVLEMRPPTVGLFKRVPGVMKDLARLVVAIRLNR
ncbi:MAG: glycosyltransferase [Myxococcales bacterium]|jgi:glycosyltransferase involved in cell wall biosynthesis